MTIVQEMVMMLFFSPSFVVIKTTGPGSISVNALLIGIVFIAVLLILFAKKGIGQFTPFLMPALDGRIVKYQ